MISPHFNKLDAQFEDVDFYKVDVDEQEEIAAEWQVSILALLGSILWPGESLGGLAGREGA